MKYGFVCFSAVWLLFFSTAVAQTDSLNIGWDVNPEPDMLEYQLYRAVDGTSNFTFLQSVPHPSTSWVDRNGIQPGRLYAYKIAAMDSAGNLSPLSNYLAIGIPKIVLSVDSISSGAATTLPLSEVVADPDNSADQLQLLVSGISHLQATVSSGGLVITPESGFTGTAGFTLTATDPDGFWDRRNVSLVIGGSSSTQITLNIPDFEFPEDQQITLDLDNYVTISNSSFTAADIQWQILDLDHLNADYQSASRQVTFTSSLPDWFGSDTLRFIALAPDNTSKTATVVATVIAVNDPPVLSLSELFLSVFSDSIFDLRPYAHDVDNDAQDLNWSFSGYSHFDISWVDQANKIVKITSLDGTEMENGTFTVTDPGEASDAGTVTLHYNSSPVNTPPHFTGLPEQISFAEDGAVTLNLSTLVIDSTHTFGQLQWEFTPGPHILYDYDPALAQLRIYSEPNWSGESQIAIKVTDPGNLSDLRTVAVEVGASVDLADIQIYPLSDTEVRIRVKTDVPSIISLEYWLDPSDIKLAQSSSFNTQHTLDLKNLVPDTVYTFAFTIEDQAGHRTTTKDSSFRTLPEGSVAADAQHIIVYPNPYRPARGHQMVIFDNLPREASEIMVFTPEGQLVYVQNLDDAASSRWQWRVVNNQQQQLASGFYIYVIKGSNGKKIKSGKVAVIR